jgi:hypothetical protein
MAFHPQMNGLSDHSNNTVVLQFRGFTTHDHADWDDCLRLAEYAYNLSVHHSTKLAPFVLALGYPPSVPLDLIADLPLKQAYESAKTFQGCKFVKQLQRILGDARDD